MYNLKQIQGKTCSGILGEKTQDKNVTASDDETKKDIITLFVEASLRKAEMQQQDISR
jgi:hypothetical protein